MIPQSRSEQLVETVEGIRNAFAAGDCDTADQRVTLGRRRAERLSNSVDSRLKANIIAWFDHIDTSLDKDCDAAEETSTATPTESPTAEPTEEPTNEPTEEPTNEPTEEPTETPTEEPTASPTPTPTAAPTSDSGGATPPPDTPIGDADEGDEG